MILFGYRYIHEANDSTVFEVALSESMIRVKPFNSRREYLSIKSDVVRLSMQYGNPTHVDDSSNYNTQTVLPIDQKYMLPLYHQVVEID